MRVVLLALAVALAAAAMAAVPGTAAATGPCTITWVGDVDGNWQTNSGGNTNWDDDTLPNSSDRVCLNSLALPYTVTLNSAATVTDYAIASGATLAVNGVILRATADSTNAGTITLNGSGAELRTENGVAADTETLTNTGTIAYAGSGGNENISGDLMNQGTISVAHPDATLQQRSESRKPKLTNAGTLSVATGGDFETLNAILRQQSGGTINGPGPVNIHDPASFTNVSTLEIAGGTIAAGADVNLVCCGPNGVSFVAGSASATGNIDVQSGDHPISGNVPAGISLDVEAAGILRSPVDYTNAGTITLLGANAEIRTENGTNADTETLTNTGTIAYAGSGGNENISGDLMNQGTISVAHPDATLQQRSESRKPKLTNAGTLSVATGGDFETLNAILRQQSGGTINGPGPVNIHDPASFTNVSTLEIAGGTIAAGADVNLVCCGPNGVSFVAGSASATGNIDVQSGDHPISGNVPAGISLDVEAAGILRSPVDYTNAGTITLLGANAEIRTENGTNADTETLTNTGTIAYTGPGATEYISGDLINQGAIVVDHPDARFVRRSETRLPKLTNAPGATLTVLSGRHLVGQSGQTQAFANAGTVQVTGKLTMPGYTQTAGTTSLIGGPPAEVDALTSLALQGGTLKGNGKVGPNVNNSGGTVEPGASPGKLTVASGYTQSAGGTLAVEINGTNPGITYDQLEVVGGANLAGTLEVTKGAFVPALEPPDRFTVVKAQSRTGTFTDTTGLGSGPFTLHYDAPPNAVVLEAAPGAADLPRIDVSDAEVTEGDSGTKNLTFDVNLSEAGGGEIQADWQTIADTATSPADFTASSGQVSFDPGQTHQTIDVPIAGDTDVEGVEQFFVRLRLPVGAVLGVARATGKIVPDDLGITKVSPNVAGDSGTATLTVRGGGFEPGMDVRLKRAGSDDIVGTMLGDPIDGARFVARFDVEGVAHGDWDLELTQPGVGGDSATADDALEIFAGTKPRLSVWVSAPPLLRFGWVGYATVSMRNEGNNDANVELLRIIGTDVEMRVDDQSDFEPGPLELSGSDLATPMGGSAVLPPGETRSVSVRFKSTSLIGHAALRIDAEAYPEGHTAAFAGRSDPEEPAGRIDGTVTNTAGDPVVGVPVSATRQLGTSRITVSDEQGKFAFEKLKDDTYSVAVGREPTAADPESRAEAVIDAPDHDDSVDLKTKATDIGGTLRRSNGTKLAGASVSLLRNGKVVETTQTDGGGGFHFSVTKSATYGLVGIHPTGGMARDGNVAVVAGTPRSNLVLTTGDRKLDVTVTGPGGPVNNASVLLEAVGFEAAPWHVRTGSNGVATFDGLPAGGVDILARGPNLAPHTVHVSPGAGTTPVPIGLVSGATIEGTVSSAGNPVRKAVAIAVHRVSHRERRVSTDGDGDYSLTGLEAGVHDVWFVAAGLAPKLVSGVSLAAAQTDTVDAGLSTAGTTRTVAIAGPGGGRIAGAPVSVRHKGTGVVLMATFANEQGVASLGPLPDDTYLVDVQVPGTDPVTEELVLGPVPLSHAARAAVPVDLELPAPSGVTIPPAATKYPHLDAPPRVDWISGIEEPKKLLKHQQGWQHENSTTSYDQPCPRANRLSSIMTLKSKALEVGFDAWYSSWESLRQLNSADVGLYMSKSAELGFKLYATFATLAQGGSVPGMNNLDAAIINSAVGTMGQFAQAQASGQMPSPLDYAEKTQEALEILREVDIDLGAQESERAGQAFALANAARDIIKLNDEVKELPNDVKQRGEAYLEAQSRYQDTALQINDLLIKFRAAVANCPDPTDDVPPGPHGGATTDNRVSNDPNEILGPAGVGDERWIPGQQDLGYSIHFENLGPGSDHIPDGQSVATAPAVQVVITHELDDDVDLDAAELGDVGWGDVNIAVPDGLQSYHKDVPQDDGDIVRVDGALDKPTRTITWTLASIDPATGDLESSPTKGFLPPEDGSGNGQGYVAYSARGEPGLAHETEIKAQAEIVFDLNEPISTQEHVNTVDADPPVSSVTSVSQPDPAGPGCEQQLEVEWSGSDSGSGLAGYDILVSTDGAPFKPWKSGTTDTSASFGGDPGHSYAFYSVARDAVGLDEAPPSGGDEQASIVLCDKTAPLTIATVVGPSAKSGWYPAPVSVQLNSIDNAGGLGVDHLVWSATGATSGGATVSGDEATVPVNADGVTHLQFKGTDQAGNTAAERKLDVKVDTKGPVIGVSSPANGAHYAVGQAVAADFACTDGGSGVETCDGSVAKGAGLDTASAGEKSFTVKAVDRVGHTTELTHRYIVTAGAKPAPVNAFTIGKLKGKTLEVHVQSAGAVKLTDVADKSAQSTRKKKRKSLGLKLSRANGGPGTIKIKLKLTSAANRTLKRSGKVNVKARITFTPSGGSAKSQTTTLKVKGKKVKRRKR